MQNEDSSMDQQSPASNSPNTTGPKADNYRVIRKRNRVPLSCGPCRHRKLKCNRQSPCDNCIKRGDSQSCSYAAPAAKRKGTSNSAGSGGTPDDMQNRIDRLEGLVLSLMTNGNSSGGAPAAHAAIHGASAPGSSIGSGSLGPNLDSQLDDSMMMQQDSEGPEAESETDGVTKSLGVLKVDQERNKTFYIGEAHWAALLNEISEVKNYFATHKKEYEAQMEKISETRKNAGVDIDAGPALLFGATVPPPRSEILRALPSKYMSDILVGRYFNTYDPATHILHGPSFQRQYQAHWQSPEKTSIVWVGMLFAIMRLAMLSFAREGDEPPEFKGKCQDMASTFRAQMAHCLITADYTKPHAFIIETLIFHLHAEYSSNRDSETSVWVLMGMIVRLAMRMGFHRDSKFFPDVTPFQGEMRRRVWSYVRTGDLLFSFQIALPPMVRLGDSDTDLPRNIYDDEFDEGSTQLPPPRPQSEATPISYMIAKSKLSLGFGRVLEEINGVQRKSYDEVLKIDKALRDIYDTVPEHLKVRPMSEQQLAPMALIAARFGLATVYNKALCVLHRRYVRMARPGNRYMYSRKTCLESAMQLLDFQAANYQPPDRPGRTKPHSRHNTGSLIAHDYLLAGTLVCMDLYSMREKMGSDNDENTPNSNSSAATPASSTSGGRGSVSSAENEVYIPGLAYTRADIIGALERSRDIWMTQRDMSMEAYKASELLNVLLYHLKPTYPPLQPMPPPNGSAMGHGSGSNDEQTAAMTLGMLQAGNIPGPGGVPGGVPNQQAMQAAQMAQQAQMQMPPGGTGTPMAWDKNTMEALMAGNGTQVGSGQNNSIFGANNDSIGIQSQNGDWGNLFGAGNGMFPQSIFGANQGGAGTPAMNIDWEAWDQYMAPANLSLDPMASLWSSGGSPSNNNFSPDQSVGTNSNAQSRANDSSFGMGGSFYASPQQNQNQSQSGQIPGSKQSPAQEGQEGAGAAGDTFMGAGTPGAGGMGLNGWKWTAMSGN
ncbi:hypothetical protein OHC33_010721 [Knufia fluminis]|uniref:Zn(2)-C6 fungal-type domain-containing protein n=1 Tax=Knufia fluminis TaxID=191047 RepID=A0AAN8I177_9EURO|nr:hypothetical protein OHC33_010721 [Knufia fluminis]